MSDHDPFAMCKPKYEVHAESYEFIRRVMELGGRQLCELSVEEAREQSEKNSLASDTVHFPGQVTEIVVPSKHSSQGIPVTVYMPLDAPAVPAIFIYFHGGGLVLNSRAGFTDTVKTLSIKSGAICLNVEYRLLPNEASPLAPFEDGVVVARWVMNNKEELGGHADSKIGIGGDSSGGHIALGITNDILNLDFQVLVYPVTDLASTLPSVLEFTSIPGLNKDSVEWFAKNSIDLIPDVMNNPVVNPSIRIRANLSQSPTTCIIVAELDGFRDSNLAYAEKLRKAGVTVECHIIKGVPHAFFAFPDIYKAKCIEAYDPVIEFIKRFQKYTTKKKLCLVC